MEGRSGGNEGAERRRGGGGTSLEHEILDYTMDYAPLIM